MKREEKKEFMDFLKKSPTSFHAIEQLSKKLLANSFIELDETKPFNLEYQKRYFLKKNGALIAFCTPKKKIKKAVFCLSHTDSPGFKIKKQPQKSLNQFELVGLEIYGAPLIYTWVNQALYPAGIVYTESQKKLSSELVEFPELKSMIPPLAIHLDREVNQKGAIFNKQNDINPIFSSSFPFMNILEEKFSSPILDFDLFLVPEHPQEIFGQDEEFLASYRIDNLSSVYPSLKALINTPCHETQLGVCLFFDHEEIGSRTLEGADSSFFEETFKRICFSLEGDSFENFLQIKAESLALSIDVAHGVHPHHPNKHDMEAPPYLGKGPVIKYSASKKYATDAYASAYLRMIGKDLPLQSFYPHGEIGSGSTVGPIFSSKAGIRTIDIGIAILGMHAMKEILSFKDLYYLQELLEKIFTH